MNRKKVHTHKSMAFLFSLFVFIIIIITTITISIIGFILIKFEIIDPFRHSLLTGFFYIAILSLAIGSILTALISRYAFRPFRQLVDATNELAGGNFDVRVRLGEPFNIDELNKLSNAFNSMAKELGSTEMLRSDFINNFSHEFKTPIVSMLGFAKILKNDYLSKEERNEYLDIIISESNRLSVLATNVLNLTKIENQSIVTESNTFDLTEQIRRIILLLESKWMEKNIEMIVDLDEVQFYGNEELIGQVWVNLLDNAIKFSPQSESIKISLLAFPDLVVFKIKDHGCGIGNTSKKRIFDKFYQEDTSHATQGNGLGLTIAKKIVELYKGKISIVSKKESGTVVTVTMSVES